MDYGTLKIIHLTGLAMTFMGLAGILAAKAAGHLPFSKRLIFHFSHGIGLLLIILTGFAMASQTGVLQTAPLWLKGKFVVWLLVGGSMVLATRLSRYPTVVMAIWTLLVLTAAWLAIDKPF